MALNVDLDFQRYIERKKGALEAQAREGAAYAYGGDLRVKKTLDSLRPVSLAVDGAVRLWKSSARVELVGGAVKVSAQERPKIDAAADQAAKALHVARPIVYVAPDLGSAGSALALTLGTEDDPAIVLDGKRVDELTEAELLFVLGQGCGHVQNEHVELLTALHYLTHAANRFVKWIVKPAALALSAWSRRAEITSDRAGLICVRSLDAATAALLKLGAEAPRIEAMSLFAESAYYKALVGQQGGLTQAEVDGKVGEVLSR